MLLGQLSIDTTISANWVMAGAVSIACFLLWRILSRMESKLENHDERINDQDKRLTVVEKVQNNRR